MTDETWISVDVETSGPAPSSGSLLSIGACLVERPEEGIEVRLRPDPAMPWSDEAAAVHRLDRETLMRDGLEPRAALELLEAWLHRVVPEGSRPVFVALNAPFDWMFVADACWRHLGRNPFGVSALDLKALYLGHHLGALEHWGDTSRLEMLKRYPVGLPHTHDALDDAREQAAILRGILDAARDAAPAGAPSGAPAAVRDRDVETAPGEQQLRDALDAIVEAYAIYRPVFDASGVHTDARIVFVNRAWQRFFLGRERDDLDGLSLYELVPALQQNAERDAAVFAGSVGYRAEVELATPRGRRLVDLNMTPAGDRLIALTRDITDQRRAEAALLESVHRYREVVDGIDAIVWDEEATAHRRFVSSQGERLTGYTTEQLADPASWFRAVVDEDRPRVQQTLSGPDDADIEYRFRRADGQVRTLRDRMRVTHDAAGNVVRRYGLTIDVTERRTLEDSLRRSERFSSMGQLAAAVAHDFDNVLYGIGIFGRRLLERHPDEADPVHPDAVEIVRAVESAAQLTKSLLGFAREQPVPTGRVAIDDVVGQMIPMLDQVVGRNITVNADLRAGSEPVAGDGAALQQVLLNLAMNAKDAMPDGGRLDIETRMVELDSDAAEALEVEPGRGAMLTVRDTGVGMDAELRSRVFEPYFTTKAVGYGTGLGLATVYGTVRRSSGGVSIESAPGHGTAFHIFLPLVQPFA